MHAFSHHHRIIGEDYNIFIIISSVTSRPIRSSETDGDGYRFITADQFLEDVHHNEFLEYGEYDGNLYGTKFQSIIEMVDGGKMVILDINPQVSATLSENEP